MGSSTQFTASAATRAATNIRIRVLIALMTLLNGSLSLAEQTLAVPSNSLEEIVVTAQKREENLQKVPLSVTALTAANLEQRGISGVGNLLSGDVPSVRVQPFAGNQAALQVGMRGFFSSLAQDISNEGLVPVYIDDVFYGRVTGIATEINDLQNITVLRGPQGTLFGKNAMGGALVLTSKEPTGKFDAKIKAEGGNLGYWKGVAHIDLPAVAGVMAKVDLLSTDNNGWTSNPAPGQNNFGVTKSTAGKLTLLYKPTDAVSIKYAGDYTKLQSTGNWNALVATSDPYLSLWPQQTTTPRSEPFSLYRPYDDQRYWGHALDVNVKFNDVLSLKSITAYRHDQSPLNNTSSTSTVLPEVFLASTDPASPAFGVCPVSHAKGFACTGALTGIDVLYDVTHHQFSQEFQLLGKHDRVDWVIGAFYLKESGSQPQKVYLGTYLPNSVVGILPPPFPQTPPNGPLPALAANGSQLIDPNGPGLLLSQSGVNIEATSIAGFGQLNWRPEQFNDRLVATAGLRVGRDKKEAVRPIGNVYDAIPWPSAPGVLFGLGGNPCPQSPGCTKNVSVTKTLPMAALSYNWTPDLLTYVRYSTGYQAPGLYPSSSLFAFSKESTTKNYEIGLKSEWLDHTLRVNVTGFYDQWNDPQETVQTSASTGELFGGPRITIKGAELEITYIPLPDLSLGASTSFLHSQQGKVQNAYPPPANSGVVQTDVPFHVVDAPRWAASLSMDWGIAHASYGDWRLSVQENGVASQFTNPNAPEIPSYWLLDGRLSLANIKLGSDDSRLEIAAWGKNLADKSYPNFIYENPGIFATAAFAAYGVPRTYGLSVQYAFN